MIPRVNIFERFPRISRNSELVDRKDASCCLKVSESGAISMEGFDVCCALTLTTSAINVWGERRGHRRDTEVSG
jgi:hypothetical protein